MANVVLFHHIQGLTPGVADFADELRASGHWVLAPDLFEGRTFDSIESGQVYLQEIGFEAVLERGQRAAEAAPPASVYAGFSLGVLPAQYLAQTRTGATGALLFHGAIPVSEFGTWPKGVRVQIHAMEGDPFFSEDLAAAREIVSTVDGAKLFLYPGDEHLFTDDSLPSYDESAAALVLARALEFLDSPV